MIIGRRLFAFLGLAWLAGCSLAFQPAQRQTLPTFYKTDFNPPNLSDNMAGPDSLEQTLDNLLLHYAKRNPAKVYYFGDQSCTAGEIRETIQLLRDNLEQHGLGPAFFDSLQQQCDAYVPVSPGTHVTAYCTPALRGSRVATRRYAYPVYRLPDDLVAARRPAGGRRLKVGRLDPDRRLVPYYTRDEIDFQGALKGKKCELLWVDDPVDLYFLQIEGSGVVHFEDGTRTNLAYAGVNGHPCRMIGRRLRAEKKLASKQLSIPGIKRYFKENPQARRRILASDPSYVFFRQTRNGGVYGCYGVPLTPYRTVAADRRYFPPGIPGYLEMSIPVFARAGNSMKVVNKKKIRTLVFNCDTGGLIRGPARIDWYAGTGPHAEALAGHLNTKGRLCLLLRKKERTAGWQPE